MKELQLDDLDQVSGGMENPFFAGTCENCGKVGEVIYVPKAEPNGKKLCSECARKYVNI